MLLKEVPQKDYAMALSIFNMPSFLCIAGYSFYLSMFRSGAASLAESFATITIASVISLLLHLIFSKKGPSNG